MDQIYLSRRNLLILLAKLDRNKFGGDSECTIIKKDNLHPVYPQTMAECRVTALEDDVYYSDREAGRMLEVDEQTISRCIK